MPSSKTTTTRIKPKSSDSKIKPPNSKMKSSIQNRMVKAGQEQLYRNIGRALPAKLSHQIGSGASIRLRSPMEFGREFYASIIHPGLHERICVKANYCKNSKKYETLAKITTLVAGAATDIVATSFGLPPFAGRGAELVIDISATALKGGLDTLCECGKA